MTEYTLERILKINDISIYWDYDTRAGGGSFGLDFLQVVKNRYGYNIPFANCLECFSGSGIIGFGLLATGCCNTISFNDIYQGAITHIQKTVDNNPSISKKVEYYLGDNIQSIPEDKKYDLIIGNPPHTIVPKERKDFLSSRLYHDEDYKIHKKFFAGVKNYLSENGIILLLEDFDKSQYTQFKDMANKENLKINEVFAMDNQMFTRPYYYIEIVHK